jgi:hypothetical protein
VLRANPVVRSLFLFHPPPSAPDSAAASEDVVLKIETPIGQDVESEEDDPSIDPFEDLGECVRCCPRVWRAGDCAVACLCCFCRHRHNHNCSHHT